jgi:3-hydroxyacyl-[acyl-carrier-protein] dehydratase
MTLLGRVQIRVVGARATCDTAAAGTRASRPRVVPATLASIVSRRPLLPASASAGGGASAAGACAAVVALHRPLAMRYVLLDRITTLSPPEVAHGIKCVSLSDDVFADHFPGHPVMPGALIVESLAQLAGVLLEATMRERGRLDLHALLTMADRARFRRPVRPGDRLLLEARLISASEDGGQARTWARVDDQLVAEAELGFAFARVTNPSVLARRREYLDIWLTGSAEEP